VEETLEKLDIPDNKRGLFDNLLKKIVIDKQSPKEAMGFTDDIVDLIYQQGYKQYQAGRYKNAAEAFKLLALLDMRKAMYSIALGACYVQMKDLNSAIAAYAVASTVDLNDPYAPSQLAECYLKLNNRYAALYSFGLAYQRALKNPQFSTMAERIKLTMETLSHELREEAKKEKEQQNAA